MNRKILEIILERKEKFIPLIFTKKQILAIKRYNDHQKLSNAQKKALYTSIKKKIDAISLFARDNENKEYIINGSAEILPERLEEAKKILDNYSRDYERVFIGGSFLFSKSYNDIDIFVIKERGYKEMWEGNGHIIYSSLNRLTSPVFQSASAISISNFLIPNKIKKKRPILSELMSTYHEAVIEHLSKEKKPESIRRLVFSYCLFCKDKLPNPAEIKMLSETITLGEIDDFIKELCKKLYSQSYLYVDIHAYIKTLEESIKNIHPNEHLIRFKRTYEELIYGSQRNKAEIA